MTHHIYPGDADPLELRGVVPPTITAFDADEELDRETTAAHARFVVDRGCHAVFPLGTNGEFPLLTADERAEVVETVASEVGDRVPVLAGIGAPSTRETIRNARRAEDAGADGLVVVTPYYYPVGDEGLLKHYRRIADAVSSPIYAYNIPKRTDNEISLAALEGLFELNGVVGCKDSGGDLGWLGQAIEAHPERTFLAGSDALLYPSLELGCAGVVSAVANVFPAVVVDLFEAAVAEDRDRSRAAQRRVYELRAAIKRGPVLSGVKAALDLRGFDVGPVRSPMRNFDEEEYELLEETLTDMYETEGLEIE